MRNASCGHDYAQECDTENTGQELSYDGKRFKSSLQQRRNGRDGFSNHQPHECSLNRLLRRRSKKTQKLRVTGLCAGIHHWPVNSPLKWPVARKMFTFDDVIMMGYSISQVLCTSGLASYPYPSGHIHRHRAFVIIHDYKNNNGNDSITVGNWNLFSTSPIIGGFLSQGDSNSERWCFHFLSAWKILLNKQSIWSCFNPDNHVFVNG